MTDKEKIEQLLWKKKILIGKTKPTDYDPRSHNIYLEAEIKEKGGQKNWETLEEMQRFKTLSISGHSKDFAGQIHDELTTQNVDFAVSPKKVQQIKAIWKKWHLNDLKAGTKAQTKALTPKLRYASNYDKALKKLEQKGLKIDKGYQYGAAWLANPLPNKIEKKIKELFG